MIELLLPDRVASEHTRVLDGADDMFAEEAAAVDRAVPRRRAEFAAGRRCARAAQAQIGIAPVPVLRGEDREPIWPPGAVGSITHCDGYVAAAVAATDVMRSVGIDAEVHAPIPDGVLHRIARPEELEWIATRDGDGVCWDRVVFSAKESVYKAWYPLARRWLGFEDATLTFAPELGTFAASLRVPGPVIGDQPLAGFAGRYLVRDGFVLTAIAVEP
jgi:4'-phosphopantetheinyl transferase EntD